MLEYSLSCEAALLFRFDSWGGKHNLITLGISLYTLHMLQKNAQADFTNIPVEKLYVVKKKKKKTTNDKSILENVFWITVICKSP